jgi:omega-amidase
MQDLNVTFVQFSQIWEDKNANKKILTTLFENIKETDLIVLPEMLFTAFSMNLILAEEFNDSESINWLISIAKEKKTAIYTSIMIREKNAYFNRGIFIFPTGEFKTYDKRKLFSLANEDQFFESGKKSTIVNYKNWNINLQICYDLRFPEISRNFLKTNQKPNYDLSIYVANWPEKRIFHWKSLLVARAIENQAFVIGVNRIGTDGNNLDYSGESCALNPQGKQLFESIPKKEFMQQIKLKSKELIEIREKMNFLKDA